MTLVDLTRILEARLKDPNHIQPRAQQTRCPCMRSGLVLAERFALSVAVIDHHANVLKASNAALDLLSVHPALLSSHMRIGLISSERSRAFRFAIRCVLASGKEQMIRADDGCVSAPLGLRISPWQCAKHCLVSFHPFEAQATDFSMLADVFELTPRQLDLMEHFSEGLSLAEIAERTQLRPQTVREAFSNLYAKFDVQGQLELMSVLAAIGTLGSVQ